jgi:hypothetical protein
MRIIADDIATSNITPCGQINNGQAEDYSITIRGGGPSAGTVTVSLTQGTNPSCPNQPLVFLATPAAGITSATYLWFVNNVSTGITTSSFSGSALSNNDVVTVKMVYVGACGLDSVVSSNFVVIKGNFPAAISVALTSGTNPGCANRTLGFTATATNPGTNPTYQWQVNGINVGTNADTFSSVLSTGDVVTCNLVSNSPCAVPNTASSNGITITHTTLTANVTISASTTMVCTGKPITFTSNLTNGGNNPQYQWYVNGTAVPTATGSIFTTNTLTNNDTVYVVYTSTDACVTNATDTSNRLFMSIAPVDTPNVSVAITKGSNPGCLDSLIEFTATVTNLGTNPKYEWFLNGVLIDSALVYSSNTLQSGNTVSFIATSTDGGCYTQDPVVVNTVMTLSATPPPPVISLVGNMLIANGTGNIQWFGPHGLITGATATSYHPDTTGLYYACTNNNGCYSAPSNKLLISLTGLNNYDLGQVAIYPNPSKGLLILDWNGKPVSVKLSVYNVFGQGLLYEEVKLQSQKTLDLTRFIDGMYYIVIRNENGDAATVPFVLRKN